MLKRVLPIVVILLVAAQAIALCFTSYFNSNGKFPQNLAVSSPAANASITAPVAVNAGDSSSVCTSLAHFDQLFVDGLWIADCSFNTCIFDPTVYSTGPHKVQIYAHTINGTPLPPGYICDSSNVVTYYAQGAATATAAPTPGALTLPRGIYYLENVNSPTDGSGNNLSNTVTLSYVSGATLRWRWATLETASGVYNWTANDADIATVASAGKKAQILLAAGQQSPCWLKNEGVPVYADTTTFDANCSVNSTETFAAADGSGTIIPIPWNTTYESELGTFISSLAAHLVATGEMSTVSGVVVTSIAQGTSEVKLCTGGSACITDTTGWTALGYSRTNIKNAFTTLLNDWATAFPNIGLSARFVDDAFPSGFPPAGCSGSDTLYPRELTDIAYALYPTRFIMGYNGLDNTSTISGGAGPGNLLPQMCPTTRSPSNLWVDCEDSNKSCRSGSTDFNTFQGTSPYTPIVALEGLQENTTETTTFAAEWSNVTSNLSEVQFIEVYPSGFTSTNLASLTTANTAMVGSPTPTPSPTPTSSPSPTPVPTGTATAVPYANVVTLGPGATLPSASACIQTANAKSYPSESVWNDNDGTGWNANNQIWITPSYYYTHAGEQINYPNADLQNVDGNYAPGGTGKTQNILLWGACKWGEDKWLMFSQAQAETGGWHNNVPGLHGGTGCQGCGDGGPPNCGGGPDGSQVTTTPNLSFLGIPVTNSSGNFIGTDFMLSPCGQPFTSWGILQTKPKYAEWYTWPMLAISTAWGTDYLGAKWRSCMNGDLTGMSAGYTTDHINAVNSPNSAYSGPEPKWFSPTETNLDHMAFGCITIHFGGSGSWYQSGDQNYGNTISSIYHNHSWPGGAQ